MKKEDRDDRLPETSEDASFPTGIGGARPRFSWRGCGLILSDVLLGAALLSLLALLICNVLPTDDFPAWVSPVLSYTVPGGVAAGLLVRVLVCRKDNHSTASFALKVTGCVILLLSVLFSVCHRLGLF